MTTPNYNSTAIATFKIAANTSSYGIYTIKGAQLVSAGVQTSDWQSGVYASQLYISDGGDDLGFQLDNTNSKEVTVTLHAITDGPISSVSLSYPGTTTL